MDQHGAASSITCGSSPDKALRGAPYKSLQGVHTNHSELLHPSHACGLLRCPTQIAAPLLRCSLTQQRDDYMYMYSYDVVYTALR